LLEFIRRMLDKESDSSKGVAKERLRLVLIQDRASMSPAMLDSLRDDLIKMISNYMEIDEAALEFNLCQDDKDVALVINIPVSKMKRDYAARSKSA
jgi:cell division topological specificity factor